MEIQGFCVAVSHMKIFQTNLNRFIKIISYWSDVAGLYSSLCPFQADTLKGKGVPYSLKLFNVYIRKNKK